MVNRVYIFNHLNLSNMPTYNYAHFKLSDNDEQQKAKQKQKFNVRLF